MSLYTVGGMMFDDQLARVEKVARELKDNAWALKSSAATDAGKLLARADATAGKVTGAIIMSTVVTAVSTVALIRSTVKARRDRR